MNDLSVNSSLCTTCGSLLSNNKDGAACPVCGSRVWTRKVNSIQRTWALIITAFLTYIPANFLPIMTFDSFIGVSESTILGGVIELFQNDMYFIGAVVFSASFIVPLFKLFSLLYLLISMGRKDSLTQKSKIKLFHIIEVIGKWSMLDIYVITIMAGLVDMGLFIQIKGGAGATFFAATVIITMLASKSFDSRLIWDKR